MALRTFIILTLFLISCHPTNKEALSKDNSPSEPITSKNTILLRIELMSENELTINHSELELSIYGFDQMLADHEATLLHQQKYTVSKLPKIIEIPVNEDLYNKIVPKISTPEMAKYYLTIQWDNNKNGQVDTGDFSIDFDKKWPNIKLSSDVQKIYLKKVK